MHSTATERECFVATSVNASTLIDAWAGIACHAMQCICIQAEPPHWSCRALAFHEAPLVISLIISMFAHRFPDLRHAGHVPTQSCTNSAVSAGETPPLIKQHRRRPVGRCGAATARLTIKLTQEPTRPMREWRRLRISSAAGPLDTQELVASPRGDTERLLRMAEPPICGF